MASVIKTAFKVQNGYAPAEGPKALPVDYDFDSIGQQRTNFYLEHSEGILQFIQAIWVDNSANLNALVVLSSTGQAVLIPAGSQGAFPFIHELPADVVVSTTPSAGLKVRIHYLNVPLASYQSGPVSVTANIAPIVRGVMTNASGAIAAGGASQVAAAADAARNYFYIQNPASEIETLYVDFGTAAVIGQAIELLPGQWIDSGSFVDTGTINVLAATTGHAFIVKVS